MSADHEEREMEALPMPTDLILETDRLRLAPHTPADFADCAAMWADSEVVRHISGKPATAEESWGRILRYAGLWATLGFGYWAVRERVTGRFLGDVGLADFKREMTPPLGDVPEIGWALAAAAHGQGYATEAVRAVTAWADAHLDASHTSCLIAPENGASIRVAAKCGYIERGRGSYRGEPTIILDRLKARS